MTTKPRWWVSEVYSAFDGAVGADAWCFQAIDDNGKHLADTYGRTKAEAMGRMRSLIEAEGGKMRHRY